MYQQVFEIYGRTVNCKLESSVNVRRSLNYPMRTWRHQKCPCSWYKFSILVLIELNHFCDRITYIFPNSIHLETVQFNLLSFNTEVVHFSSLQERVASRLLYCTFTWFCRHFAPIFYKDLIFMIVLTL